MGSNKGSSVCDLIDALPISSKLKGLFKAEYLFEVVAQHGKLSAKPSFQPAYRDGVHQDFNAFGLYGERSVMAFLAAK